MVRLNSPTSSSLLLLGWDTPTLTFSAASSERLPSYSVCLHSLPSLSVSLVLVKGAPAQRPTLGHSPLPEGRR